MLYALAIGVDVMGLWLRGPWVAAGTNRTGVLLLHGFSGDPQEMIPLGAGLAAAGFGVHIPVLPGHGGVPQDLAGFRWTDWLDAARADLAILRDEYEQVIVAGYSMGGALALILAAEQPLTALLLLATPLYLQPEWLMRTIPLVKYLLPDFRPLAKADFSDPSLRAQMLQFDPAVNLDDPTVQAALRKHIRLPMAAIGELVAVLRTARRTLSPITTPTLVMHGTLDETAPPASASEIVAALAGSAELVWWHNSGHLLLVGPEQAAIVARAVQFCRERGVRD